MWIKLNRWCVLTVCAVLMRESAGGPVRLRVGEIVTTGGVAEVSALGRREVTRDLLIVQFRGRIDRTLRELVTASGVKICGYVPERALLVRGNPESVKKLGELLRVRWVGKYCAAYKIDPAVWQNGEPRREQAKSGKVREFVVTVWDTEEIREVRGALEELAGKVLQEMRRNRGGMIRVATSASALVEVAEMASVEWIEPYTRPRLCMDVATGTAGIYAREARRHLGLSGRGQLIGHADSGIDTGNPQTLHADLRGRVAVAHALVRENDWSDPVGHGTHTAGILVGTGASRVDRRFQGVAPEARLVHQTITDKQGVIGDLVFDFYGLLAQTYEEGARVHSDSWGAEVYRRYTWLSRMVDEFVWDAPEMLIVCAAGNSGWDANRDGVVDGMNIIAQVPRKIS